MAKNDADEPEDNDDEGQETAPLDILPDLFKDDDIEALIEEISGNPDVVRDPQELRRVIYSHAMWQGPLPPPNIIQAYNHAVNGFGSQLTEMFLEESSHRRKLQRDAFELDREVIRSDMRRADTGLWLGFIIAIAFLIAAVIVALYGEPFAGVLLGSFPVAAIVAAFFRQQDFLPWRRSSRE